MIHIRYFGILQTALNTREEQIEWSHSSTGDTDALLAQLRARGEPWFSALAPEKVFKIAVNRQLIHSNSAIADGAEVGFLPPVTGG